MIKITFSELKSKIEGLMELGLTNPQIAERLNQENNATSKNSLSTADVAKLKAKLGLKGTKPKKQSLFELVEEAPVEDTATQEETSEFDTVQQVAASHTDEIVADEYGAGQENEF